MKAASPIDVRARGLGEVPLEFVNAKLRGRRARLYEGARLRHLVEQDNVQDLAYELFPREDLVTQVELERHLAAECAGELGRFAPYVTGAYGALYDALLSHFAVENLKVLLRVLGREDARRLADRHTVALPARLELPVDELLRSRDEQQFAARIPLPSVRSAVQGALPLFEETERRGFLEMAMDRGRWEAVAAALDALPRRDRAACRPPIACESDGLRLAGALRAATVYEMPWERFEALLPAGPGELSVADLRRVYARPQSETVLEVLPELRHFLEDPGRAGSPGALEEAMWRRTLREANRQYYGHLSGPAILVSYYYLKRNEQRSLAMLAQMVRVGMRRRAILERLGL